MDLILVPWHLELSNHSYQFLGYTQETISSLRLQTEHPQLATNTGSAPNFPDPYS